MHTSADYGHNQFLARILYENNLGLISVMATAESSGMAEGFCWIETKVSEDLIK